jgi:hypothetical protein
MGSAALAQAAGKLVGAPAALCRRVSAREHRLPDHSDQRLIVERFGTCGTNAPLGRESATPFQRRKVRSASPRVPAGRPTAAPDPASRARRGAVNEATQERRLV